MKEEEIKNSNEEQPQEASQTDGMFEEEVLDLNEEGIEFDMTGLMDEETTPTMDSYFAKAIAKFKLGVSNIKMDTNNATILVVLDANFLAKFQEEQYELLKALPDGHEDKVFRDNSPFILRVDRQEEILFTVKDGEATIKTSLDGDGDYESYKNLATIDAEFKCTPYMFYHMVREDDDVYEVTHNFAVSLVLGRVIIKDKTTAPKLFHQLRNMTFVTS